MKIQNRKKTCNNTILHYKIFVNKCVTHHCKIFNVVGGWKINKLHWLRSRTYTIKRLRQTELKQPTASHKMKVGGQRGKFWCAMETGSYITGSHHQHLVSYERQVVVAREWKVLHTSRVWAQTYQVTCGW